MANGKWQVVKGRVGGRPAEFGRHAAALAGFSGQKKNGGLERARRHNPGGPAWADPTRLLHQRPIVEAGVSRPRHISQRDYQFTRTPNRMTRGATIAWMLFALFAFWLARSA